MDPENPDAHSRRGFLRVAGVAGGAAAAGAVSPSGTARFDGLKDSSFVM